MSIGKCTMTGCGKEPTHVVVLAVPGDVAEPGGEMNKGALADLAHFPACADHVDHIAKVFYGAAYALSGTVTASEAGPRSSRRGAPSTTGLVPGEGFEPS